jgi:hypothetical protein
MRSEGKIEKPEDKEWRKWYDTLDNKEHEKKLAMLGLDKEDIDEWEHHSVFQDIEQEIGGTEQADGERTEQKKKKPSK